MTLNRLKLLKRVKGVPPIAVIDGSLPSRKQLDWVVRRRLGILIENLPAGTSDLAFLEELGPSLSELVVTAPHCHDASAVARLTGLKHLTLWIDTRRPVALGQLQLQSFVGFWDKNVDSIFDCASLRYLHLEGAPPSTISRIPGSLEYLQLAGVKGQQYELQSLAPKGSLTELNFALAKELNLDGIEALTSLRTVTLTRISHLTNAQLLSGCRSLEKLWIEDCRNTDGLTDGLDGPDLTKAHIVGPPSAVASVRDAIKARGLEWQQEPDALPNPLLYPPVDNSTQGSGATPNG